MINADIAAIIEKNEVMASAILHEEKVKTQDIKIAVMIESFM